MEVFTKSVSKTTASMSKAAESMSKIVHLPLFQHSPLSHLIQSVNKLSLKSLPMLAVIGLGVLPSSLLHADDLANLIRQKSQPLTPSSSISNLTNYVPTSGFGQLGLGTSSFYQNYVSAPNIRAEHIDILYRAENSTMGPSQQVLRTVRQMTLDNKEIIKGSCWDYLNAAFTRAGVKKETIFKGEYPYGPFIDTSEIRPGDWLYYINHGYNDIEHSGLFVGWLNRDTNEALILSYAGESRNEPARYKVYDISHTYNVMRPSL